MPKLLAITRKSQSASFEQRVAGYAEALAQHGLEVESCQLPHGVMAQHRVVQRMRQFDGVWWQRHLPQPWWLPCVRRSAKRLVFDFDDPLIYSARGGGRVSATRRLRFRAMLRRCDAALPASEHLADLARPYCQRIFVQPMPIDLPADADVPIERPGPVTLLWLGSAATQPYLELIRPALEQLGARRSDVSLRLVAHEPMTFGSLRVDCRTWSPAEQDAALRECHLGLCPMPDTIWTRGKCPYKVLQYMAWAMPWVGAAVGENLTTAGEGDATRGLCPLSPDAWLDAINRLVDDPALGRSMGLRGRAYVSEHHGRGALAERLVSVWREVLAG